MRTWGIDWATEAGDRGAVLLHWDGTVARVVDVRKGEAQLKDEQVIALMRDTDAACVAVDVPFGWPSDFHRLLSAHELGPVVHLPPPARSALWRTRRVAWRETDRAVHERSGLRPRSVAFDLLGATAASWAVVEAELGRSDVTIDRSGIDGTVVESYPAAVRLALGLPGKEELRGPAGVDLGEFADPYARNEHVRDALVAAVAARARALGLAVGPSDDVLHLARIEGWIQLPAPGTTMAGLVSG